MLCCVVDARIVVVAKRSGCHLILHYETGDVLASIGEDVANLSIGNLGSGTRFFHHGKPFLEKKEFGQNNPTSTLGLRKRLSCRGDHPNARWRFLCW